MNVSKNKETKINELTFNKKELMYYKMIDKYFRSCSEQNINKMISIINGESEISLRVLDWVVTRYAKKKIDFNNNDEEFFISKLDCKFSNHSC